MLGLTGRGTEEWARLRGYQYAQLALVSRARLLAQALAALVVVTRFAPFVGYGVMAGWLGALCGSLSYSALGERPLGQPDRRRLTREEFRRQALGTAVNAMVWALAVLSFAGRVPVHLRFELWTMLTMLMTVSAVIVPTVPLATLVFSLIVGGACLVEFLLLGQPGMAGVVALFVGCIVLGCLEASRHFLLSRLAVAGMAEKSEVVSLLLGEFDEAEADWLWQTDSRRRVRGASARFAEALGLTLVQVEGENLLALLSGRQGEGRADDAGLLALAQHLKAGENFAKLLVRVQVGGQLRYWSLSGAPRYDEAGAFLGFRGVASDVTEQQVSKEKIAWLARYDTLTGLANRMMVTDALDEALVRARLTGQPCALLMIDLDRFKAVNDTLGHPVGDRLLAQVGERLKVLATANMVCGRLGGDEFCVVVRHVEDRAMIPHLAQAIISDLTQPYRVDSHEIVIGASVGSAFGPEDGASIEDLMRNADFALYRAKRGGRGMHSAYDEALQAEAEARARMERALQQALDKGEFALDYQPVVDAHSERVVCLEALLRWHSPELGLLGPDQFLTLADETCLSLPVGAWVLREACGQAMGWPGKVRVSVNVSERQALDPAFVDHVVTALAVSGLAPQRLEIEVTEAIFLRDPDAARAMLERLTGLGCGVTLDDFGVGHASIRFLCEARFGAIKLDRALMKGAAAGNAESIAMIRAVVALADSLEMIAIAKGVETASELETAYALGCRRLQGRAYGEPMAQEAVAALFAGGAAQTA